MPSVIIDNSAIRNNYSLPSTEQSWSLASLLFRAAWILQSDWPCHDNWINLLMWHEHVPCICRFFILPFLYHYSEMGSFPVSIFAADLCMGLISCRILNTFMSLMSQWFLARSNVIGYWRAQLAGKAWSKCFSVLQCWWEISVIPMSGFITIVIL
jgi:hypothetical protein